MTPEVAGAQLQKYGARGQPLLQDGGKGAYQPLPQSDIESGANGSLSRRRSSKGRKGGRQDTSMDSIEVSSRDYNSDSCLSFVEASWFQLLAGVVIIANTFMLAAEASDHKWEKLLFWPDQFILTFYVFELIMRISFFRGAYFCDDFAHVAWNVFDLIVVLAGVVDQWLLDAIPGDEPEFINKFLSGLRALRLFRVLKLARIFIEADFSWCEDPPFQSFIGGVIAFNSLLMGVETDMDWSGWFFIEQGLLIIYCFELSVRLKKDGFYFFVSPDLIWNWLDFTIVGSSVTDSWLTPLVLLIQEQISGPKKPDEGTSGASLGQVMMLMRMLRLMRILRLVRLVKSVRPLYNLVMGVMAAMQGVFWVLVLTVVTLYAVGIMTTRIIGHGLIFGGDIDDNARMIQTFFATVPDSMFLLFKLMNGAQSDADTNAIDGLLGRLPALKFGFVFFMITSSWTLLSILTAVVSENMISTTGKQEHELHMISAEEERNAHVREIRELFLAVDMDSNGILDANEMSAHLGNPQVCAEFARICQMPMRDVITLMREVSEDGMTVGLEPFVEVLVDACDEVTEKSIFRLESKINKTSKANRQISDMLTHWRAQQDNWQRTQMQLMCEIIQSNTGTDQAAKQRLVNIMTEGLKAARAADQLAPAGYSQTVEPEEKADQQGGSLESVLRKWQDANKQFEQEDLEKLRESNILLCRGGAMLGKAQIGEQPKEQAAGSSKAGPNDEKAGKASGKAAGKGGKAGWPGDASEASRRADSMSADAADDASKGRRRGKSAEPGVGGAGQRQAPLPPAPPPLPGQRPLGPAAQAKAAQLSTAAKSASFGSSVPPLYGAAPSPAVVGSPPYTTDDLPSGGFGRSSIAGSRTAAGPTPCSSIAGSVVGAKSPWLAYGSSLGASPGEKSNAVSSDSNAVGSREARGSPFFPEGSASLSFSFNGAAKSKTAVVSSIVDAARSQMPPPNANDADDKEASTKWLADVMVQAFQALSENGTAPDSAQLMESIHQALPRATGLGGVGGVPGLGPLGGLQGFGGYPGYPGGVGGGLRLHPLPSLQPSPQVSPTGQGGPRVQADVASSIGTYDDPVSASLFNDRMVTLQ